VHTTDTHSPAVSARAAVRRSGYTPMSDVCFHGNSAPSVNGRCERPHAPIPSSLLFPERALTCT